MEKNNLDELMAAFVKLPSNEKREEIIKELKEQIAIYQSLCSKYNFETNLLLNKEMLDVTKEDVTDDDYYEAIYAYLKCLENIAGQFLNKYLEKK